MIAFTHTSGFTAAARPLVDNLIHEGFAVPADSDTPKVFPSSVTENNDGLAKAWSAYERDCDPIMHK